MTGKFNRLSSGCVCFFSLFLRAFYYLYLVCKYYVERNRYYYFFFEIVAHILLMIQLQRDMRGARLRVSQIGKIRVCKFVRLSLEGIKWQTSTRKLHRERSYSGVDFDFVRTYLIYCWIYVVFELDIVFGNKERRSWRTTRIHVR